MIRKSKDQLIYRLKEEIKELQRQIKFLKALSESQSVSDNEESKEIDCSSCTYNRSGNIGCISCGESLKNYKSIG